MQSISEMIQPIKWHEEQLHLLDQRLLPLQQVWLSFEHTDDVTNAIRDMVVRGAPAIGVTAAYAVVLASRQAWNKAGVNWKQAMYEPLAKLAESRPTAVNLAWAIEKMTAIYVNLPETYSPETALLETAIHIHQQDIAANQTMGKLGADLIAADSMVLTHCNAGALATGGFGTALGVIRQGYSDGKIKHVYVDETRPWLQGARLTAWELMQDKIPCTLQADVVAAALMASVTIAFISSAGVTSNAGLETLTSSGAICWLAIWVTSVDGRCSIGICFPVLVCQSMVESGATTIIFTW